MSKKEYPLTIENRWDTLYSEYPEKYDEFCGDTDPDNLGKSNIHDIFDLSGKTVVDIGSGTGASSFNFARFAERVIGIEPEQSMREIAEKNALEYGVSNVEFKEGIGQDIPLPDNSTDVVTAITAVIFPVETELPKFLNEAERITKPKGLVIIENSASYGGDLEEIVKSGMTDEEKEWAVNHDRVYHQTMESHGYSFFDYETRNDYGTVEEMVRIYGFIFGTNVIDYIRETNRTKVSWKWRIHYKRLGGG